MTYQAYFKKVKFKETDNIEEFQKYWIGRKTDLLCRLSPWNMEIIKKKDLTFKEINNKIK